MSSFDDQSAPDAAYAYLSAGLASNNLAPKKQLARELTEPCIMRLQGCTYDGVAQPGCSSQALWRFGRAGGGRRSPADRRPGRGAGPRACLERAVHRRADPAPPLPANDAPPAAVRAGL